MLVNCVSNVVSASLIDEHILLTLVTSHKMLNHCLDTTFYSLPRVTKLRAYFFFYGLILMVTLFQHEKKQGVPIIL